VGHGIIYIDGRSDLFIIRIWPWAGETSWSWQRTSRRSRVKGGGLGWVMEGMGMGMGMGMAGGDGGGGGDDDDDDDERSLFGHEAAAERVTASSCQAARWYSCVRSVDVRHTQVEKG
jgi:hypothetical protein